MSIGEFARLAGVSVRMLRHYDAIGLLRPARVDEFTGYRFYTAEQLDRANGLVALKDLGFGLDEVASLLAEDDGSQRLIAMLRTRRDELLAQIATDQQRVTHVEARLRLIDKEDAMSEYSLTDLPALRLVQLSTRVADGGDVGAEIGPLFTRVNAAVQAAGLPHAGPGVAMFWGTEHGSEIVVGEQIGDAPTPEGLQVGEYPVQPRALTTHYQSPKIDGIQAAWQALMAEVEARGLTPNAPCREVYLATPHDPDGTAWDVELQAPVA